MFWLTLIVGMQVFGFGVTLGRLAYDEWQQWRLSCNVQKANWGPPDRDSARVLITDLVENRAIQSTRAPNGHAIGAERALWDLSSISSPVAFSSIMDPRAQLDSNSNLTNSGELPPLPLATGMCERDLSSEAA